MSYRETDHLRVLIANERKDRLALVAPIVAALGHEVIAREIDVEDVGVVTARERLDVALVGLGESSDHALGLIEKIVQESACPVIALLHAPDAAFVKEASKRGVFAYITDADPTDWQNSIDIVLRRLPSTTTSKALSGVAPSRSARRESSWNGTLSTKRLPSTCSANRRARRTGSSWTSPRQWWTASPYYRSTPRSRRQGRVEAALAASVS
jgi:DNA-binding NtrC family response regulator